MQKSEGWEKDLPDLKDKKREKLLPNGRGSLRLSLGLYYLEEDYEKMRKKVLSKKLP